jgi:hypothetical protein
MKGIPMNTNYLYVPVFLMIFVFLPRVESSESIDVSYKILDRMTDRANEHFEKANRYINEETEADLKELKEKMLAGKADKDKYIWAMGVALRLAKDCDVDKTIFLPYVEEILAIKTDSFDSLKNQLHILSDVVRVEREHFKTDKEFSETRKKRVDQILSIWGKATAEVDESWRIGKKLSLPAPYQPPKEYTEKEVFFPGIYAWLITDEIVRRDYEVYLEKRAKVFEADNLQRKLFDVWRSKNFWLDHLTTLYTTPPYATEELEDMLRKYKVRASFTEELLKRVNQIVKEKH